MSFDVFGAALLKCWFPLSNHAESLRSLSTCNKYWFW